MSGKTYVVKNPNRITPGVVIVSWRPPGQPEEERNWYEGDAFVQPPGMDDESVTEWIELGFIEEV